MRRTRNTWRNQNLTLTLGLRVEYERGATERYDRGRVFRSDSRAADLGWRRGGLRAQSDPRASGERVRRARRAGVCRTRRQTARALAERVDVAARVSAAWQLGTKTIARGGYGVYYDTLNVMNSAVDQYGFSRATRTQLTNDAGTTWLAGDPRNGISPLVDPFPVRADGTRFDVPLQDALGAMARVGEGYTFGRYDREHPRVQRWRVGIQRGSAPTCWSRLPIGGNTPTGCL